MHNDGAVALDGIVVTYDKVSHFLRPFLSGSVCCLFFLLLSPLSFQIPLAEVSA